MTGASIARTEAETVSPEHTSVSGHRSARANTAGGDDTYPTTAVRVRRRQRAVRYAHEVPLQGHEPGRTGEWLYPQEHDAAGNRVLADGR